MFQLTEEQQADKVKGLNPYRGFTLEEKLIANGAAVTISGSYDAVTNSIDIGDSLTNPNHTIALGASAVTSNRPLVVAILYTVVCTLALAAATYYLLTLAKR